MSSNTEYTSDDSDDPTPIKYLLLGDTSTNKIITEFTSPNVQSKSKKEINQIFKKLSKYPNKKIEEQNKIASKNENYYFTFYNPSLIYIVLVNNQYRERLVFELIRKINEENIPSMINDETRELNPGGRQALKQLIDAYQDPKKLDKIGQIQKSVDSIKIDMKDYIVKMIYCEENVKDLENKTNHLQLESNQYQKNSQEIRTITWWQNIKLWILLGLIVILLIVIIILIVT